MKNNLSRLILVCFDVLAIVVAIIFAFYTRKYLFSFLEVPFNKSLTDFLYLPMLYVSIIGMLYYVGAYSKRFDFWHESKQVIKALFFAFLLVMSYFAITKSVEQVSRLVIVFVFIYLAILIPLFKNILKKMLFKIGLWQRKAKVYGNDIFIKKEIFSNHYIGYVDADSNYADTVFINSQDMRSDELTKIINAEMKSKSEVVFIPRLKEYELSQSFIYELSNIRTNLIEIQNRLRSKYRLFFKQLFNYVLAILLLPILLPIIGVLAFLVKRDSSGPILFKQERLGQDGKIFMCYKFRTMVENGDVLLEKYLQEHPEEVEYYDTYHKYMNDPRITKIGHTLRKTSLDELPQIFNVLKSEMSFVGPRPYMLTEKEKMGEDVDIILMVKPGITGLWQVSGRNDVDFRERIILDRWYVINWSLWLDIVILLKTVKVVLFKEGAY